MASHTRCTSCRDGDACGPKHGSKNTLIDHIMWKRHDMILRDLYSIRLHQQFALDTNFVAGVSYCKRLVQILGYDTGYGHHV
jgi:hypothetical protein